MLRTLRFAFGVFLVASGLLAAAGCGTADGGGAGRTNDPGPETGGPPEPSPQWTVSVTGTRDGAIEHCLADPSIVEAVQTADYPSSHLGITLAGSATAADAARIADCLRKALASGDVSVSGPDGADR